MARNGERYRVRTAGRADCAYRARRTDGAGDVLVGARLAARNTPQRFPNTALEHRAANVQRHPGEARLAVNEGKDLLPDRGERVFGELGVREFFRQKPAQAIAVIAELDGAKTLVRGRREDGTERGRETRIADLLALAARTIVARPHA